MAATRWLTFDCHGTIADWNTGMLGALEPVADGRADQLLGAYYRAESVLEPRADWPPYREILTEGLNWAARQTGVAVAPSAAGALADVWSELPIFPDVAEALSTLVSS